MIFVSVVVFVFVIISLSEMFSHDERTGTKKIKDFYFDAEIYKRIKR